MENKESLDNPFLRMKKACQGSCEHPSYPAGEERCYTKAEINSGEAADVFFLGKYPPRSFFSFQIDWGWVIRTTFLCAIFLALFTLATGLPLEDIVR